MKRGLAALVALVMLGIGGMAWADYVFEYTEGKQCAIGADVRVRLTHFDRNAIFPEDWGANNGPALEYMRVRERIWACFDLWEGAHLKLRLVNRWHHYSSAPWDPNNQAYAYDDDQGNNTWNFPDEVIFDQLMIDMADVADLYGGTLSLRIGRQDMMFGNGMIWLEGTPFDQGRTIYFDGVRATWRTEKDTVDVFAVNNGYKDNFLVINDRERPLRLGDVYAFGTYWTHSFNDKVNTDLYYFYTDIDDDAPTTPIARNMKPDTNAEIHTAGIRVFGTPDSNKQVSYSLEYAQQWGNMGEHSAQDLTGSMVDARLALKAAEGTPMQPVLSFEYTYWSGDDPSSANEYEGWHPLFSMYPIWREELLPILLNAWWTNLHQLRTALTCKISDKVTWTGAWAVLRTEYGENAADPVLTSSSGNGSGFGHLLSTFIDIDVTKAFVVRLEGSWFRPSDYFNEGHGSEWLRCELVYTFGVKETEEE